MNKVFAIWSGNLCIQETVWEISHGLGSPDFTSKTTLMVTPQKKYNNQYHWQVCEELDRAFKCICCDFYLKKHLSFNAKLRLRQEFYNLGTLPVMIRVITPFIGLITPSYPFIIIRPVIGAITPFIPGRSPSSSSQPTMAHRNGSVTFGRWAFATRLHARAAPNDRSWVLEDLFWWFKPQKPDHPPWNSHTVDGRNPAPPGMVKTL